VAAYGARTGSTVFALPSAPMLRNILNIFTQLLLPPAIAASAFAAALPFLEPLPLPLPAGATVQGA